MLGLKLNHVSKRGHRWSSLLKHTVYPKKYAHGFVVLCFVVVMKSFIMNSHEVFIHIRQGCFASTGAIVRLPQCQWSKPDGYGKISQCITTTKHSKAKTVCIFLGIYCTCHWASSDLTCVFKQNFWLSGSTYNVRSKPCYVIYDNWYGCIVVFILRMFSSCIVYLKSTLTVA